MRNKWTTVLRTCILAIGFEESMRLSRFLMGSGIMNASSEAETVYSILLCDGTVKPARSVKM